MTSEGRNRRSGGLRPVATALPKITRKALGRRGLAEGSLIAEWPEIVGETLAARCLPIKLSFADPKRRAEGTLILQVESAWTLELQHLAPQLIERINQTLGYAAVARLNFRQGPLPGRQSPPNSPRPEPKSPSESAEDRAAPALPEPIEDEALRAILEDLGRSLGDHEKT